MLRTTIRWIVLLFISGVIGSSHANASDSGTLPLHLSDLNLMGGVGYDVQFPLWSDGAVKTRQLVLPPGLQAAVPPENPSEGIWNLPIGSILVKEFVFDYRVETRILRREKNGWEFASYRWSADQVDAVRVDASALVDVIPDLKTGDKISWKIPSPQDCVKCHGMNSSNRGPLALKISQLGQVQVENLNRAGLVANVPADLTSIDYLPSAKLPATYSPRELARGYLDVNCASCHRPEGFVPTNLDLRWTTLSKSMNAVGVRPLFGSLGIADASIIKINEKEKSILWRRMMTLGPSHMPYLGSTQIDLFGVNYIGEWIDSGAP